MVRSHVIQIDGAFAGAAVQVSDRYRFVAVDPRAEELDLSDWPSLADVQRVVGHLIRTGSLPPRAPRISLISKDNDDAFAHSRGRFARGFSVAGACFG